MKRPHLSAALLALLALALAATGAPLPFPREVKHPALKALEGEWVLSSLWTSIEDPPTIPELTVTAKSDRLRLYLDGRPFVEWAVAPSPEKYGKALNLRLTGRSGGITDRIGVFQPDEASLLLRLVARDVGLTSSSEPSAWMKAPVHLTFRRKAP